MGSDNQKNSFKVSCRDKEVESNHCMKDIERILFSVSAKALSAENPQKLLQETVTLLGESLGVSRVYIFQIRINRDIMDNTVEWCNAGITPQIDNLQDIPVSMFPWWFSEMQQRRVINYVDIETIPDETTRQVLRPQGILSILVVPLLSGNEVNGFIGFDECTFRREWPDDHVEILWVLSRIISEYLERKKAEESIRKSEFEFRRLFTNMTQGVVYHNREGKMFSANPVALETLGFASGSEGIRTLADMSWNGIHEDGSSFKESAHPAILALRTGEKQSAIMGLPGKVPGSRMWISISSIPVFHDGEEDPDEVFTTFEDITNIKESNAELNRINKRLEVLRTIDHALMQLDTTEIAVDELAMKSIYSLIPCQAILLLRINESKKTVLVDPVLLCGEFIFPDELLLPDDLINSEFFTSQAGGFRSICMTAGTGTPERLLAERGYASMISEQISENGIIKGVFVLLSGNADFFTGEHVDIARDIAAQITLNVRQHELKRKLHQHAAFLEEQVTSRTRELEVIVNALPDMLFRLDRNGVFIDARNCNNDEMFFLEEPHPGASLFDVLPSTVAGLAFNALEQSFDTGEPVAFEYELNLRENTYYLEIRIIDLNGQEALAIVRDITQRKSNEHFMRIQRDLATQLNTLRTMSSALNHSLEALMQIRGIDFGGIYLFDKQHSQLNLVAHKNLSDDFIHKVSQYDHDSIQVAIVKTGRPKYLVPGELGSHSSRLWQNEGILSLAVLPLGFEGEITGCINLGSREYNQIPTDVRYAIESLLLQIGGTIARISAELELQRSQQNFQTLFDSIDDFMFILDSNGGIIRTNPVVTDRLGYTNDELKKMHVLDVHPHDKREEAGRIVGEMLEGQLSFCPIPLITKDNREIPVETRVVPGRWDEKDVLFGISRDVTEHKKYEKVLQESIEKEKELNKIKSRFISVASHEFRTPLSTIMAASDSLLTYRKKMSDAQIDDRLRKVKLQVTNLDRIIDEVLNLSKIQSKEMEINPVTFNIADTLLELVQELRERPGQNIPVHYSSLPASVMVVLDHKQVRLIFSNLLSNAIKYSPSGGRVEVDLVEDNNQVVIKVKDHGIGIPMDEIPLLFTPFFRASNTGNIAGTGLGLNIVLEAVHRHRGTIDVESRINDGTTFTIRLPKQINRN